MPYFQPNMYFRGEENRSLLLPLLVGAAVGFPFGYIASNTNKINYYQPYQPYPLVYQPGPAPMPYPPYNPYHPYQYY